MPKSSRKPGRVARRGVTLERALEVQGSGNDLDSVLEPGAGFLIAGPGERADVRLLADLDAGVTYALVCSFRDAPEAPPHTASGDGGDLRGRVR